jgi:hypothetical protein
LVPSHYNFSELEKRHYYSSILKFAITILLLLHSCHFLRLPTAKAPPSDRIYTHMFIWFPFHSLTCGPRTQFLPQPLRVAHIPPFSLLAPPFPAAFPPSDLPPLLGAWDLTSLPGGGRPPWQQRRRRRQNEQGQRQRAPSRGWLLPPQLPRFDSGGVGHPRDAHTTSTTGR